MRFQNREWSRAVRAAAAVAAALVLGGLALAPAAVHAQSGATTGATGTQDKVRLRAQLGIIYAQNQQPDEARKEFVKLLEEPTGRAAALTNLGNLAAMDGQYDTAIENYNQAAALDTADGGILLNLGLALKQNGQDAEADKVFTQALAKTGGPERAAYLLGVQTDSDTAKGKASKMSNAEIKAMLNKASTKVPQGSTGNDPKTGQRTQVVSRPGGARAAEAVGATSLYWKEK
jgi:Tfp pilus assembly protein PilF